MQFDIPHQTKRITPAHIKCDTALYTKGEKVGAGGFGNVYQCIRNSDNKLFAAKYILAHEFQAHKMRFANEVMCMKQLHHFACVECEDAFIDDDSGDLVIILEWMDAGDLHQQLSSKIIREQWFSKSDLEAMFVQLLLGLHRIHSAKMLHRDIKPKNILVTTNGLVKIADFGLSNQYETTVSGNVGNTNCGTQNYLAPERLQQQGYGSPADVWSLGAVLYEMMELEHPFKTDDNREISIAILAGEFRPMHSQASPLLNSITMEMLQRNPSDRPSTSNLLKRDEVQKMIQKFHDSLRSMIRLEESVKERIAQSLKAVATMELNEPTVVLMPELVHTEGWVEKFVEDGPLRACYLVLKDQKFEVLDDPTSPRGGTSSWELIDCCVFLIADNAFVIQMSSETHFFKAVDADQWVTLLNYALIRNRSDSGM